MTKHSLFISCFAFLNSFAGRILMMLI